jgi:DNA-binding NtrC family response regulator
MKKTEKGRSLPFIGMEFGLIYLQPWISSAGRRLTNFLKRKNLESSLNCQLPAWRYGIDIAFLHMCWPPFYRHFERARTKGEDFRLSLRESISSESLGLSREPESEAYLFWGSNSTSMLPLEHTILHTARTSIPVLLAGESGTGKEIIARQIHRMSSRCHEPLVKTICASSAAETLVGYFPQNGSVAGDRYAIVGTLFLKEISELETASQRALLYSLPGVDLHPEEAALGPRVVSSTTKNLEDEVRAGRFRTELYYRINGIFLHVPPLRQRKEDIPALAELLLMKHAVLLGQPRPRLDSRDLDLLQEHSWPGNIRELENVVRKIVALNDAKTVLSELVQAPIEPPSSSPAATGSVLKAATRAASRRAERQLILDALTRTRWNRKRAAQELQISYKSLLYKLKEIGPEEQSKTEEGSAAR